MEITNILNKIEEQGFEAYIIGGYVRDYLLGKKTNDVDICTNAKPKDLLEIFSDTNITSNIYGTVKIITNEYNIDIATYRKDIKYNDKRKAIEIEYIDNLIEDIKRRDFTINTICMNKSGDIIDLIDGREDLNKRIIRCVGNIEQKITEDPLRILRTIRFATVLDFSIEANLYESIKRNAHLVENLPLERVKEELTKILINANVLKGLTLLKETGVLKYIGIEFDYNLQYVSDICGMYSQLSFKKDYPFTKEEKESIKIIRTILNYGKIDKTVLYKYGLYFCIVAGDIMGINKEYISSLYEQMEITKRKDINITSNEICSILNIKPSKIIKDIYDDLEISILTNKLINDNLIIKKYIQDNREKWENE